MDSSDDDALAALAILYHLEEKEVAKKKKVKRLIWTRPWIQNRLVHGAYHALIQELKDDDPRGFKNFLRMDIQSFYELRDKVTPLISKQDTNMRLSIPAEERLALTLRWLATGNNN